MAQERTIPIGCGSIHARWWGPDAPDETVERSGHFPWFERPDVFRSLLDEFLATPSGSGATVRP